MWSVAPQITCSCPDAQVCSVAVWRHGTRVAGLTVEHRALHCHCCPTGLPMPPHAGPRFLARVAAPRPSSPPMVGPVVSSPFSVGHQHTAPLMMIGLPKPLDPLRGRFPRAACARGQSLYPPSGVQPANFWFSLVDPQLNLNPICLLGCVNVAPLTGDVCAPPLQRAISPGGVSCGTVATFPWGATGQLGSP